MSNLGLTYLKSTLVFFINSHQLGSQGRGEIYRNSKNIGYFTSVADLKRRPKGAMPLS